MKPSEIFSFFSLRDEVEREAPHLMASGEGRKEGVLFSLARFFANRDRMFVFVAMDGGEMVGYLNLMFARFEKLRGNAYLSVSVKASHRNLGIGTRLMEIAENFCKEKKMHRLELEVFARNSKAIELYRRLGYVEEGRKNNAVQTGSGFDDIVFMAKQLV